MAKYVLLYQGGGMPQSNEETAKAIQQWTDWYNSLGAAVVDPGYPFTPVTKTVTTSGQVTNGATGKMATGYTIVKAETIDEAVGMAQACPVLLGGADIAVYETFEISGQPM
jgi:hypothetical protein